jgi:hypothetical protein
MGTADYHNKGKAPDYVAMLNNGSDPETTSYNPTTEIYITGEPVNVTHSTSRASRLPNNK